MLTDVTAGQSWRRCLIPRIMNTLLLVLLLPAFPALQALAETADLPDDLSELSLEDLMEIEVTSASKKPQKLANSATAIYVITQEDIRRSGVTSIPEALRMAPGVEVTRLNNSNWGISIRGFNGRFANKLLVLIDGRSVYTPLFSGVYWDEQDTMLEDIERIEVIRGSGATLWGANAVNGVINIITRNSADTQGCLMAMGTGSQERAFSDLRYGSKLGEKINYRIYGKYFDRNTLSADTHDAADSWNSRRGGFRVDGQLALNDTFTFQGDIYNTDTGNTIEYSNFQPPYEYTMEDSTAMKGGNLLFRWQRHSAASDLELQTYYDRTDRDEFMLHEKRDTFDFNFQHRFQAGDFQEIIWGAGYRFSRDNMRGSFNAKAQNSYHRSDDLYSCFLQDELALVPEKLTLILGSKFEHNNYTGYEVQPNGRILWSPNNNHTFWAAVSRAVRTPSRAEHDSEINSIAAPNTANNPYPFPVVVNIVSSDDFDSEEMTSYELGYRFLGLESLSLDFAAFYSDYDNLRTFRLTDSHLEAGHLLNTFIFDNEMDGTVYGGEVVINWQPLAWWNLVGIYSYQYMALDLTDDNVAKGYTAGANPHHQASLRSRFDLPENFELDLRFRYVDDLPEKQTDSYISMDMRIGWQPFIDFHLDLVGQNLLDNEHFECKEGSEGLFSTEIERSVYLKATWEF